MLKTLENADDEAIINIIINIIIIFLNSQIFGNSG